MLKATYNELKPESFQSPSTQVSVLLAFYNKIDFLKLVLASLEVQTFKNFELIICDDGSREDVLAECSLLFKNYSFPIYHLWQEDLGFRKNKILNEGLITSHTNYLIFIDGDCVLHPNFIEDHWTHRKPKTTLSGRRVDLTPQISQSLTPEKIKNFYLQKNYWWIFFSILWMKDNNAPKGIRLENPFLKGWAHLKSRGLVGCNYSIHKQDLLAINGFDTRYNGPGIGEDTDVEFRLRLAGIEVQPFTHLGVQYHLYHPLLERPSENANIFSMVQIQKKACTDFGITGP